MLAGCAKEESVKKEELSAFKTIKGIDCVLIKAGSFLMGAPEPELYANWVKPQHKVILTKDFYLGMYEVTNAQYCEFLNAKKIDESGKCITKDDGEKVLIETHSWGVKYLDGQWLPQEGYEDFPVVCVSWYGADEFCRWAGGKLPTNAQWEYANKAGTSSKYFWGDGRDYYSQYAWCKDNSDEKTHKVGAKFPNPWGLYDTIGNVGEFCSDWHHEDFYANSPLKDPEQTIKNDLEAIYRGGAYFNNEMLSYHNRTISPASVRDYIGFRFCYIP